MNADPSPAASEKTTAPLPPQPVLHGTRGQNRILAVLALGLVLLQALIGGARPVYALPCYLLIAAAGMAGFALRNSARIRPNLFCVASALALALYVVLRGFTSPVAALARADVMLALAALLVYLLCAVNLTLTEQRFALILVLLLVGVAHVVVGILQFKDQVNYMLLPWIARPDYGFRASGFYINPNHLAALLGMLALLAVGICCWSRVAIGTRLVAFYGFVGCLTGIALTGSRAGYFSSLGGLVLFALLSLLLAQRFNRPNFFGVALATAFVLTCIVAGALLFVVRTEGFEQHLRHVLDPSRNAQLLRPAMVQQHRLKPLFGTGSGTTLYFARAFAPPEVQHDPQHAHNEYLELLAEYGWTGAGLFGAFVLSHLVSAIAGLRRILDQKLKPSAWTASNELALLSGALCGLFAVFSHAARDFLFHLPANLLVAAFLFAILANPTVESLGRRERHPLPGWLHLSAPIVAVLLFLLTLPRFSPELTTERAREALRDGHPARAAELAQDAWTHDRGNADLAFLTGEAKRLLAVETADSKRRLELRHEAADAFSAGLQAFPQDVRLLLKLGQVRDDLGDFAAAEEPFALALAAAPNFGSVLALNGLHWHRQRQLAKARAFYEQAHAVGETEITDPALHDLERDEAFERANQPFSDLLPDPAASGR